MSRARANELAMLAGLAQDLARLALLAQDLERKRVLCLELQALLDAAERAGAAVDGERWILNELQEQLESALQVLRNLQGAEDAQLATRQLDQLDDLLSDVQWELTEQVRSDLEKKHQAQRQMVRDYEDQLAECQARLGELAARLGHPSAARAALVREKLELQRAQALYDQAQRALREQQYGRCVETLGKLREQLEGLPDLLNVVEDKTKQASHFARQAELLLLQYPLDAQQRYQYMVMLRTPSEPGSYGISIRGSSTLVKQDRELMGQQIDDITRAIDAGLARQFALRGGQPAMAAETPAATGVHEGTERTAVSDVARDLVLGGVTGGGPVEDVSLVVQKAGELMYSLFMPEQMQTYLSEKPCALTITTNDLELPWELMFYEGRFLCLDRPMARMPMGGAFPREEMRPARAGGRLRFLLVYADPEGNLPAAWSQEILPIQQALQEQWQDRIDVHVLNREQAQGSRLNDLLRSGEYDVIHYAGHAFFDKEDGDLSGLLLQHGEVFFAQKIRRLLRGRPLVFLNACQTGRTANEEQPQKVDYFLRGPAEGLASAFVYGGASGCIGSLWPIYDRPAAAFAIHFYNRVLEGHMIGEALRLARVEIRRQHPESITWAAFVLYGDPTIRLAD